jgi:hypothetical protein
MRALKWLPVGIAVAIAAGVAVADVGGLTGGAGGGTTITDTLSMTGTTVTNLITSATSAATATTSVGAFTIKPVNTLNANDLIVNVKDGAGTSVFQVDNEGDLPVFGKFTNSLRPTDTAGSYFLGDTTNYWGGAYLNFGVYDSAGANRMDTTHDATLILNGRMANGGTAVAVAADTGGISYSTTGAKLLSVKNNGTEKFSVDKDGAIKIVGTTGGGTITLSGGTGTATVLTGHRCVCTDTTAAAAVKCAVSGTTLTATGTTTDVIAYFCF